MFFRTLSGRFLLLSFIFVMIAEVLIFIPSVAEFREDTLQQRLELASLASLALLTAPDDMVSPELSDELLNTANVLNIVLKRDGVRELVLAKPIPRPIDVTYDLRNLGFFASIVDVMEATFAPPDRIIRVMGQPMNGSGIEIEVVLNETSIKQAMAQYASNTLLLSLFISTATGLALFLTLQTLISKPILRVVDSMTNFKRNPEDANNVIVPASKISELRDAETTLQDMQIQLTNALRQKEHLVSLGEAVSKISHDLRNMLATAQILADTMEMSDDPKVKKTTPKLVGSLARAINLCESTLKYGKAEESEPDIRSVSLKEIVDEVIEYEGEGNEDSLVQIVSVVPHEVKIWTDPDQLFRTISNLIRNARQAIETTGQVGMVSVLASPKDEGVEILVRDTGPGLPDKAKEFLFQPFHGGARRGGTGLGLAIAEDLVKSHGGKLQLAETSQHGTTFSIYLPDREK